MAFNDGPHPALLIDEVLERILEYAASGEPFRSSRNLRLVCKQWQSMSFKGLCCSTSLPVIHLHHNNYTSNREEFIFKGAGQGVETNVVFFRKLLPKRIPAFMAISEPRLPIEIRIGQPPLPEDVAVIREFSRSVASLRMGKNHFNPYEEYTLNKKEYDFKLPNLRSIVLSWEHIENFQPWQQCLQNIMDISNRHVVLKYDHVGSVSSGPNNWPTPLPQLTHLQFEGLATDLERFITPLKKLVQLDLMLNSETSPDTSAESALITQILEHHSAALEKVKISYVFRVCVLPVVRSLKLPPAQFLELRVLETNIPILLSKGESNSTNLPKLKELKYVVGYHPVEESDGFKVSHLASNSLVKLVLSWNQSPMPDRLSRAKRAEQKEKLERPLVNKFVKESFPPYPKLLDLSISGMPFDFALAFMTKLCHSMTNLTRLCLNLDTGDLVQILTGVATVPKNPALWRKLFKDQPATITNLNHLEELEIRSKSKCIFGRFIFDAAFLKMDNLRILRFGGAVEPEQEMIQKWSTGPRKVYFKPLTFGNQHALTFEENERYKFGPNTMARWPTSRHGFGPAGHVRQ